jgi:hypothetical protein
MGTLQEALRSMITIHHVKEAGTVTADIHLYCGRGENNVKGLINARMGNPFIMKKWDLSERDRVCDAYERHLDSLPATANEWRVIERMKQRLAEGKTIALYCYCSPQRCHCESIKNRVMA